MNGTDEQHDFQHTHVDLLGSPGHGRFPLFGRLGEAVAQVAASAGELLVDKELRRKASNLVVSEAGKRIKDIQEGVATRAGNIQRGLNEGPRQVQSIYSRIQRQYMVNRQEASLRAKRDTPVDVQVGPFLWEDAPQELRSRLWIALLGKPHLIGDLVQEKALELKLLRSDEGRSPARCSHQGNDAAGEPSATSTTAELQVPSERKQHGYSTSTSERQPEWKLFDAVPAKGVATSSTASHSDEEIQRRSDHWSTDVSELHHSLHSPNCTDSRRTTDSGKASIAAVPTACQLDEAAADPPKPDTQDSGDAWEIVQAGSSLNDYRGSQLSAQLQAGKRGSAMTLRERILEVVCDVAWPISTVYPEGCKYDTLCQISVGQEEVEEVIERDINRTFPEHPQFSFEQGQQELFRVLKAYSLHDLQVGYCQGMAFVTGVILMYVPEEPAFRLLTRLMDERGANLRLLYLPGLEGLKNYLRMFKWLMDRMQPELREHLEDYGVVPVLYASQWFLTAFSCPFPASFSCRVIDVMLTENCGHVMLRVALAVIQACTAALMELHDFEDLVTYLKVEPVKWTQQKARSVLNEAVEGSVNEEMLAAAAEAVAQGYDGSLSRRVSAVKSEGGDGAKDDRKTPLNKQLSKGHLAVPARLPSLDPPPSPSGPDAEEQLELHTSDEEIMIALDALWVGESSEVLAE